MDRGRGKAPTVVAALAGLNSNDFSAGALSVEQQKNRGVLHTWAFFL